MMKLIDWAVSEIIADLAAARADTPRRRELAGKGPWLVYGAGNMGRKLARELKASGREVAGFIDAAKVGDVDGLPAMSMEQALAAGFADAPIALGLHNPAVDASAVKESLLAFGFSTAWMPQEYVEALPVMGNFWLQPIEHLANLDAGGVREVLSMFDDESSVRAIQAIARWRFLGLSDRLPEPDVRGQYHPADLPALPVPLRMIDCGAYTGDTLFELTKAGHVVELYVGLEPDPANYVKLVEATAAHGSPCVTVPCGVWSRAQMLAFEPNDAAGAVRTGTGTGSGDEMLHIQCLSIDEAFCSMAPNFVKMDIEGAESHALNGCAETIKRHAPRLAVSSYHSAMDLWLLPIKINKLMIQADRGITKMALRCHASGSFDSVIYAWIQAV